MIERPHRKEPERSVSPDTLPALKVPNKVVWVNKNLLAPFELVPGEESDLGLMLTLSKKEDDRASFDLGVRAAHRRSGDIGRVVFEDTQHRKYRDIDLKGVGLSGHNELHVEGLGPPFIQQQWYRGRGDVRGLMERTDAETDAECAEQFTEWGIRTHRAIGIIALEQLSKDGKLQTVSQLKENLTLPHGAEPVVEVRAFGTKARVSDMLLLNDAARKDALLADVVGWLQTDLARTEPFSLPEYAHWFAETLGKNVGIMHRHDKMHGNLHQQNITLDCRIVDLDSVRDLPRGPSLEEKHTALLRDVMGLQTPVRREPGAEMVLSDFLRQLANTSRGLSERDATSLLAAFERAYIQEYPEGLNVLAWGRLQPKEIPPGRY